MIISQLPELFVQRERALLGPRFDAMFSYPGQGAVRGASVNALRCTPQQFAALADFPLEASPFCASAFMVPQPDWKPGRHPYHHAGAFYAQEPSASAPAALLDVHPGMRVADLCAAPGGKTSQLAAALAGQGVLLANEFVAARAEVLRQNLERMGVTNAIVTNEDTARLAAAYPGQFDRILVDAPCSGEGMFRKESVAVTQYDQPLLDRCAALGAEILENAAAMLAPGGILVYSTCTFAPGEDEGQIAAFLARHPEFTLCDLSAAALASPVKPTGQGTIRYRQNTAAASGPVMAARAILWPNCKRRRMPRRWNCRAAKTVKEKAAKHPVWMPRHCRRGRALPKSFSPHWRASPLQ